MSEYLPADYIEQAVQRARRFSGAYTGTSGTLAADVMRLWKERKHILGTIEKLKEENAALRAAVEARLAGTTLPADVPQSFLETIDGYAIGPAEVWEQPTEPVCIKATAVPDTFRATDHVEFAADLCRKPEPSEEYSEWVPPAGTVDAGGSAPFLALLDAMRDLHLSKSKDYGSESDPLANIRQGAELVGIEPWRGCCVRIADKVQRLKTFCRTGTLHHEGVRDTLLDLAAYSLLAIVLHDEERQ